MVRKFTRQRVIVEWHAERAIVREGRLLVTVRFKVGIVEAVEKVEHPLPPRPPICEATPI